jgi:hypothetical protein
MTPDMFIHEWHNRTTVHPLGLALLVALGVAMLLVDRRWALAPLLVLACFIPPAQRLVVAGLDFTFLRLLVLVGWARVLSRGEYRGLHLGWLDGLVAAWVLVGSLVNILQWGTAEAAVNRLGFMYDALGIYLLVRCLVRGMEDVKALAGAAAVLSIPVAASLALEALWGRNIFAALQGVPELPGIREGKGRYQGAFGHPILAGVFFASLAPMAAALWDDGRRTLALAGVLGSLAVIALCNSSTPVIAAAIGFAGCCAFVVRRWTLPIVAFIAIGALALHLVMQKPIWHLLARTDVVGGSTGYYRYVLLDQFIQRFDEWWLLGTRTTANWWEWGMADVTNQYVLEGVNGGVWGLGLFLSVLVAAFATVGRAVRAAEGDRPRQIMAWAAGVSLLVHAAAFVAVSYFAQGVLVWYLALGLVGALGSLATGTAAAPAPRSSRAPQWPAREGSFRRMLAGSGM